MIADLLPARLWWEDGRGGARLGGRLVHLQVAPVLLGIALDGIDYAPGEVLMIKPAGQAWRVLHDDEIAAARDLLEQITKGAT